MRALAERGCVLQENPYGDTTFPVIEKVTPAGGISDNERTVVPDRQRTLINSMDDGIGGWDSWQLMTPNCRISPD